MWIVDDLINQALYDWRKREMWEREDTAVQRRAKDLEAAGLSKTLAAGSAATTNYTSGPEFRGGAIGGAIEALSNIQSIKNAREENANMRKSREVMNAEIALKFADMQKEYNLANYYKAAGQNQLIDGQLKSEQMRLFAQQILESQERSKGYQFSAKANDARANLDYWNAIRAGQEIDLINSTGQNSSVGGLLNPAMRIVLKKLDDNIFQRGNGSSYYHQELARGYKWNWEK